MVMSLTVLLYLFINMAIQNNHIYQSCHYHHKESNTGSDDSKTAEAAASAAVLDVIPAAATTEVEGFESLPRGTEDAGHHGTLRSGRVVKHLIPAMTVIRHVIITCFPLQHIHGEDKREDLKREVFQEQQKETGHFTPVCQCLIPFVLNLLYAFRAAFYSHHLYFRGFHHWFPREVVRLFQTPPERCSICYTPPIHTSPSPR